MIGLPGHLTELSLSAEEVAQQLQAFPALTEDLSFDPVCTSGSSLPSVTPVPRTSMGISGHLRSYSHTDSYSYITKNNKINL